MLDVKEIQTGLAGSSDITEVSTRQEGLMKIEEKDEFEENSGFNSSSGRRNMSGSGRHDRGDRETEQHRKLFIGGLTYSTTDDQLRDFYSQWGEIVDCIVMRDPMTKRSRGFGFITYSEASMLDESMQHRPHVIDGKEVEPKRAVPRELSNKAETQMSVKRLFVSGIKDDHTTEMLHEYFTTYGEVADVDIIIDKATGAKRGFAFVTFEDYDPVDKCVLKKSHMIAGKRCDVKKALSKEEMLKAQQQERDRAGRGERSSRGYGESGGRSDRGSSYGGYSDRGGGGRNSDYGSSSGMGGASAWSQGSGPSQSWGQQQQSPWGQMGPTGGYGQQQAAPVMASGGGYGGGGYGGGNGGYGAAAGYPSGYGQAQPQMAQGGWGNQQAPTAVPAATGYGQQTNSWAQQPMPQQQQNPWQQQTPAASTYPPSYGTQPTGGNPGWGQQPAATATGGYGAAQVSTGATGYNQPTGVGSSGGWSYGK